MQLRGKQKAAMMLMCLDPVTANKLLKSQPHHVVEDIAMELARIDANKEFDDVMKIEITKEFCGFLNEAQSGNLNVKTFVSDILDNLTDGSNKLTDAKKTMQQRDPFVVICSCNAGLIAAALEGEHPQTMAIVLSELPPKLGTDVLKRLDENISRQIVIRMTKNDQVPMPVKKRVGEMISNRLESMAPEEEVVLDETKNVKNLREIALVLSGLDKQLRDTLLEEIEEQDEQTGKTVRALLVTWEDITKIADRSLQQALRNIEPAVLAKALVGADDRVSNKIRDNISERASAMVDEEIQLMSKPTKKEIVMARDEVIKPLREANEAEELAFVDQED